MIRTNIYWVLIVRRYYPTIFYALYIYIFFFTIQEIVLSNLCQIKPQESETDFSGKAHAGGEKLRIFLMRGYSRNKNKRIKSKANYKS